MQHNNGHIRQHMGSSFPVQELVEGSDTWVRKIRSILQAQENPLTMPHVRKGSNQKRDQTGGAKSQSD